MAKLNDPDDLNQGTEVVINTTAKTIQLVTTGNLSDDGVTGQCLYSFLKEEWNSDASLIKFVFPMETVTPESFEWVKGWLPADDTTRNLLRECGWREINNSSVLLREYLGVVTLGNIDSADTAYYAFENDTAVTNFDFSGTVDQGIQTYGNAANGNFDKRTEELTVYIRVQGKTYDSSTSVSIGVASGNELGYIARRFPLTESADLNISASDATIAANTPYTGMDITYHSSAQSSSTLFGSDLAGGPYNFGIVIDGNGGTKQEIYEFVQWSLRQPSDIDADSDVKVGLLQDALLAFTGARLDSLSSTNADGGGDGVAITSFDSNDTNSLQMTDNTGSDRAFPFVSAGSILPNANLQNDSAAVYRMFFATNPSGDFDSSTSVTVEDNSGTAISGSIGGASSIGFDFDYDGNVQGGRTAGTDADIVLVAIGEDTAQYVLATGTITRASGLSFPLTASLERGYNNP